MATIPGIYDIFNREFQRYQSVWLTSDTHFAEDDLKAAFPQRPSDEELVKRINSVAGKTDLLIHLGDVGDLAYLSQLRATVWLILGNHDSGKSNYQRKCWVKKFDKDKWQKNEALDEMKRLYPNCRYSISEGYQFTSPFEYWEIKAHNNLAHAIFEGPVMLGEKIILSHEPIDVPWAYNIHGHVHNASKQENSTNVCLDACNYQPLNFNQFIKSGAIGKVKSLHRETIDIADARCKKRGYRLSNKKTNKEEGV